MSTFEDQRILKLAELGYNFSKLGLSRVSRNSYIPFRFTMNQVLQLENMRLLVWENIADLDQIGLGRGSQFDWTLRDWEKAIRKHKGLEIEEFENDDALRLARNGFKIVETNDRGYNFYRWGHHIKYYRNRKCATNKALKIIKSESALES